MVVFENVTKIYEPDVAALQDVSFEIDKGEFVFIVGASGSGKSTVIRLVLKEIELTRGKIVVGGRDLARLKRSKVPMLRRNVGCVFQDFKLLPNRTAAENVAYALKVQGESQAQIRALGAEESARAVGAVLAKNGAAEEGVALALAVAWASDGLSTAELERITQVAEAAELPPSRLDELIASPSQPRPSR